MRCRAAQLFAQAGCLPSQPPYSVGLKITRDLDGDSLTDGAVRSAGESVTAATPRIPGAAEAGDRFGGGFAEENGTFRYAPG